MLQELAEALVHGGIDHETRVNIHWIESEDIERQGTERILREADGILIPGGFGARGIEGKIDHDSLCAGAAGSVPRPVPRHAVCHDRICAPRRRPDGANSAEFDERSPHPVIHLDVTTNSP